MRKNATVRMSPWIEMQKEEIAAWVKETLRGAKISFAAASRQLGLPPDAISKVVRCERDLTAAEMAQIAEMANATVPQSGVETGKQPRYVRVIGEVAAGLWRDVTGDEFEEYSLLALVDKRWPIGSVFACKIQGESINRRAAGGDHAVGLKLEYAPRSPQTGDWVIVDRIRHDLRERTVKRYKQGADGGWELWPYSTDPRYQEPLTLGESDGEVVLIIGYVLDFVAPGTRF